MSTRWQNNLRLTGTVPADRMYPRLHGLEIKLHDTLIKYCLTDCLTDWVGPRVPGGGAHLGAGPTGCGWLSCGALPHMLAVWRGGRRSSAGAREPGNEPSAYSPRPGWTRLGGGEETHRIRQSGKEQKTPSHLIKASGELWILLQVFIPSVSTVEKRFLLFFSSLYFPPQEQCNRSELFRRRDSLIYQT